MSRIPGQEKNFLPYKIGDTDRRPWGEYRVTDVGETDTGEEYCEKSITVIPGKILSLQSHDHRRESWRVERGTLTVVLDGQCLILEEGKSIEIPLKAIHCMANLTKEPCTVYERQTGLCREDDITRYVDAYGRATQSAADNDDAAAMKIAQSVASYRNILEELERTDEAAG